MRRFLPVLVLVVAADAHAKPDYYHPEKGWTHATTSATSSLDATHGAAHAVDTARNTAWCAGKGLGTGEALTITFAKPITATGGEIRGGVFDKLPEKQRKQAKPAAVMVSIDGQAAQRVELTEFPESLKVAGTVTTVKISFAEVKLAKKAMACLTEVRVVENVFSVAALFTSDEAAVAGLEGGYPAIGAAIAACDADKLGAMVKFPFAAKYTHVDETRTSGGSSKRTDKFADAAALVKAKCDLPPFIGNPAKGKDTVLGQCHSTTIDRLVCNTYENGADVNWTFVWETGIWRLVGVTSDSTG
jgi:hypothetical protein